MAANTSIWTRSALSLLSLGLVATPDLPAADAVESPTAKLVVQMIPQFHVSRKGVDDLVSSKLLDSFLKDLDPAKLYFQQSDIDEFSKYRTSLDDALKNGDVQFGYDVFKRYKERLVVQLSKAHQLIDADHDFNVDESMVVKGDTCPGPGHRKKSTTAGGSESSTTCCSSNSITKLPKKDVSACTVVTGPYSETSSR